MNSEFVPIIRLSVEGMKEAIIHSMGLRGCELSEVISKKINEGLDKLDFSFESEIKTTIGRVITKEIENYFSYGDGNVAIKQAVSEMFLKQGDEHG